MVEKAGAGSGHLRGALASGGVEAVIPSTRAPMTTQQGPNQRCSHDFMSDALADGRRVRIPCILCVSDDFSRECPATLVDTSLSGLRVARELDRTAEIRGFPGMAVSDNGTELTSNAMPKRQQDRQVEWHCIAPGKPMRNTLVVGFNDRLREERPASGTYPRPCAMPAI